VQDPFEQCVRTSKKTYSELLRKRAGLSSWAADFGLVGLKNLYAFLSNRPNGSYRSKKLGYEKLWWSTYQIIMVIFTRYPAKASGYQMSVAHLRI
jgi:hypothetical protein